MNLVGRDDGSICQRCAAHGAYREAPRTNRRRKLNPGARSSRNRPCRPLRPLPSWRAYINRQGAPPSSPPSLSSPTIMSSFLPLYKDSPVEEPARSLASIWSPQPQPLEPTWSRPMASYAPDPNEYGLTARSDTFRTSSGPAPAPSQDTFRTFGLSNMRPKPVGTIGDGRMKEDSDLEHAVRPHTDICTRISNRAPSACRTASSLPRPQLSRPLPVSPSASVACDLHHECIVPGCISRVHHLGSLHPH